MSSAVMTVNLMLLTVAGPFLLAMILVYAVGPGSLSINHNRTRCLDSETRLVSVIRYIYEDSPWSFQYVGTAIMIGNGIAITVPQAVTVRDYYFFREKFQRMFYLSSGSMFWYNEKAIQRIKDVTFFPYGHDGEGWATGEIVVFHTHGSFPNCTPCDKWLSVSKAPVPEVADRSFSVHGWRDSPTRAYERYVSEHFDAQTAGSIMGGVIYKDKEFWGMMRTSAGQQELFFERHEYEGRITNRSDPAERARVKLYMNFNDILDDFKKRYPEAKIKREEDKAVECGTKCPGRYTTLAKSEAAEETESQQPDEPNEPEEKEPGKKEPEAEEPKEKEPEEDPAKPEE
ncbi:unnamed protein product [Callosobruchus maculatus]|uniref:Uncharacterized protein n=1 Tax=Callosobruchus maculatus TaxID=64391 RepID=A0A653CE49_CALMS|nr:unnamed protein product [Callosobruchus maculatus]